MDTAWSNVDSSDDITLTIETDCRFEADPDRLHQLLVNLLQNAVEHGGTTIRVGRCDNGFYVADDGPGIPNDDRDAVFDRGHSTSDSGTGFGLAIVETIAHAHGWTVTVTDSDDGGARFEITDVEIRH